jgi:hypothetical protein
MVDELEFADNRRRECLEPAPFRLISAKLRQPTHDRDPGPERFPDHRFNPSQVDHL